MRELRCRILEIDDVDGCIDTMQIASRKRDTDEMCNVLTRCFRLMLPRDDELQRLSLLQQQVVGSGGVAEYAVTTLWLCALQSIIEAELIRVSLQKKGMRLSRSASEQVLFRPPRLSSRSLTR